MQETPDNLTLRFHPRGGVREDDSGGFEGGASLISTETLVLRAASVASMTFWSEFTDSRPLVLGRGRPCSIPILEYYRRIFYLFSSCNKKLDFDKKEKKRK